jgi:hypothetical protein
MDETKPMSCTEIVNDPDQVFRCTNAYIMLHDMSIMGSFKNMIEAINLLARRGWETVSISTDNGTMYALCRNTHFKDKNEGVE